MIIELFRDINNLRTATIKTRVKIHWSTPEEYTESDLLINYGDIRESFNTISKTYELSSSQFKILNKIMYDNGQPYHYFSRKIYLENPLDKVVIIYKDINNNTIEYWRGSISDLTITPDSIDFNTTI